jgi:hypothetical protein
MRETESSQPNKPIDSIKLNIDQVGNPLTQSSHSIPLCDKSKINSWTQDEVQEEVSLLPFSGRITENFHIDEVRAFYLRDENFQKRHLTLTQYFSATPMGRPLFSDRSQNKPAQSRP